MRQMLWGFLGFILAACLAACQSQQATSVREVDAVALDGATLTPAPAFIVVTPTPAATAIPTLALASVTPTLTSTPIPSPTPDLGAQQAQCASQLQALYQAAGEACLGQAGGFVCNGGLPPVVEPAGNVANGLASVGGLVSANEISALHSPPLLSNNSGGIVYLHLREGVVLNGLMIGDVRLRDLARPELGLAKWSSIGVETNPHTSTCADVPRSAFIVQSQFKELSRFVLNGVSVELDGSLIIETGQQDGLHVTYFIAIEGLGRLTVLGTPLSLYPGMQAVVGYNSATEPADWTFPRQAPRDAVPLDVTLIEDTPVMIMDRPVLLPQAGFAQTLGNVNMRTAPDQNAQLIYQVPPDQILSILGRNEASDWLHIRLGNGETGWMRADLLGVVSNDIRARYDVTPLPPQRFGSLGNRAQVITAQGANLRTAPDTGFGIMTTLPQGTMVELLARSPYSPWVKVNANNAVGWVALITLETQSVIGFLPVDYSAPLPTRPTATPVFNFGGGHAYPNPLGGQ